MLKVVSVFCPPCPLHKPFTAISLELSEDQKKMFGSLYILSLRTGESGL